jgi:Na+/H+ antiporter NhaD/arsenite permease-like protein
MDGPRRESTLAGNVTLLGAVSNLIVADQAEKLGVRIRLSEFVRQGAPVAAITMLVLVLCLAVGL